MNKFKLVETYLKDIPNLRFEWALKISPTAICPRLACTFWVTNYSNTDISSQYNQLHILMEELNCPKNILSRAKELIANSKSQGLLIYFENGCEKRTFYVQHSNPLTNKNIIIGLKWNNNTFTEENIYEFNYFAGADINKRVLNHIHPQLQNLIAELLTEPLLIQSGYTYQIKNNKINEVYITYPWHPAFNEISAKLENHFSEIDPSTFHEYTDNFFRHIGFSTYRAGIPIVTVYFSARFKGNWPLDFESLKNIVRVESEILNKQLNCWIQTK